MVRALLVVGLLFGGNASRGVAELVERLPLGHVDAKAEQTMAEAAPKIVLTPELIDAYRAVVLAKSRLQQARVSDLPRARRAVKDQIVLAEAELEVLKRRSADYRPFLAVGRHSPVRTAAENHRLAQIAVKQRLEELRDVRIAQMRSRRSTLQLYQLDLLVAQARFAREIQKAK